MVLADSIFLLPNGTFFFELVIFIVVLAVMAKFILPPIERALRERAALIRDAQRASDEGHSEAAQLVARREAVIADARADARRVLEQAGQRVEERRAAARERAQAEHDTMLGTALAEVEAERTRVTEEILGRLDVIVVAASEQVLGSQVDAAAHHETIGRALSAARAAVGR